MMADKEVYQGIKKCLEKLSNKCVDRISQDTPEPPLKKNEVKVINDLAFKIGWIEHKKRTFKKKELERLYTYGVVWVTFELFRRLGTIEISEDGIPKKTRKGKAVYKLLNTQTQTKKN